MRLSTMRGRAGNAWDDIPAATVPSRTLGHGRDRAARATGAIALRLLRRAAQDCDGDEGLVRMRGRRYRADDRFRFHLRARRRPSWAPNSAGSALASGAGCTWSAYDTLVRSRRK